MKKKKEYQVNIDMTWSENVIIKGDSIREAKEKAWQKFLRKIKKKNFKISAEQRQV